MRWQHPTRGIVGPIEFIALAEETGLIAPLGRWVLEQAVAEVAGWRRSYPGVPLRLAVNVSGQQLARPEFLGEVREALRRGDLPPEQLGLEITESVLMKDASSPRSTLEALRGMGVRVLIDDFGTGYSSLARLRHFPVDVIKIDRSFVDGLGQDNDDTAIVAAVIEIARSMDLQVIAEGVEVGRPARAPARARLPRRAGLPVLGPDRGRRGRRPARRRRAPHGRRRPVAAQSNVGVR